jgi:hypothetical protein
MQKYNLKKNPLKETKIPQDIITRDLFLWRIQQRNFWELKKNSPYLEKKKLEVARFRQCVPLGRQN